MAVCVGTQREIVAVGVAPTHGTVLQLARKVEGFAHKLCMGSSFSSPALFDDVYTWKINCSGTVHHSRKNVPHNFEPKVLKMKKGDMFSWVLGNLGIVCWKDKRQVCVPHQQKETSGANLEIL
jgi:hypothetical protein